MSSHKKEHSIKDSRENILSDAIITNDRQLTNQQSIQDAIKGDVSPKKIHLEESVGNQSKLNQDYLLQHGKEILHEHGEEKHK